MVKIRTLNELSQLRDSEFNQPRPRHGINLLYWFARSNQINPATGAFGFHLFRNRVEDDDDELLPNQNLPYYEVGNLNAQGADKLPSYIRPTNRHYFGEYNKDRIIVRVNQGRVDRVYVTEHEDARNFSPSRTYRVSQGLLSQIGGMEREEFLKCMNVYYYNQQSYNQQSDNQQSDNQQSDSSWSWCTIL